MEQDEDALAAEKNRRRRVAWATAVLFIGLPVYLWMASWVISLLTQPIVGPDGKVVAEQQAHWAVQLLVVTVLGLVWALPLKRLFWGLGRGR
ncbi:MAG: DUF2842 domain-containing protein [Neomegalonema sp.]|nr:DUF2842 domain-containing protein [Neomegalonema sp.]